MIVRRDLPEPHRAVQACHAILAATNTFGDPRRTHPHLVLCGIQDEPALADFFEGLKLAGVPCCAWYEDDMRNALTAVATAPLMGKERKMLRKLPLLGS